nr:D-alanyl-D-alanine carboxypeptidase/D-alanyl-D-alanine-endopeptidase [Rhodococcus rhodnii]
MSGESGKKSGNLAARRHRSTVIGLSAAVVIVLVCAVVAAVIVVRSGPGDPIVAAPPAAVTADPGVQPVPEDTAPPSREALAAALAPVVANPALGTLTGVVSDAETGEILWSQGESQPMIPASTTKLLTAAAALLTLELDSRVETTVVAGAEPGSIVLVGTGDPTITSLPPDRDGYYPGAAHLTDVVEQIRASGTEVTSVAVDTSRYTGSPMAQGWLPEDVGAGFITPTEPVMIDGGRADPAVDASPRSPAPALDAAKALASALGVPPESVGTGTAPDGAQVLATVQSAPLRDRLLQMMEHSDNVLAESIGREVAMHTGRPASFDGATDAVLGALADAGLDTGGAVLHDTSGLSVDNRLSAGLLDAVLTEAVGDDLPALRPMLDYLPVAGATGSLSERYATDGRVGAGWVRAKTGTLSEASGLAGYVVDSSTRVLAFALMSNGTSPDVSRPALDAVAATLRTCGCE